MAAAKLGDRKGVGVISCGWTSSAMSAPLRRFDATPAASSRPRPSSSSASSESVRGNTTVDLALSFGADFAACNFGAGHLVISTHPFRCVAGSERDFWI